MFNANDADFDRNYYYVNDKPLHVSFGHESEKHLQIMDVSENRRHISGEKPTATRLKY